MNKLRKIYQGLSLWERLVSSLLTAGVLVALLLTSGEDILASAMIAGGVLVGANIFILYPKHLANALVVLLHTGLLAGSVTSYGSLLSEQMGTTGYMFAVLVLTISSVIIGAASYRWSVGKLWLTLLLAFLSIDVGGMILIAITQVPSIFLGLYLAAAVLAVRAVHWRGVLNRGTSLPLYLQRETAIDAVKSLLESQDGIYTQTGLEKYAPINAVYRDGNVTFLMNVIAPNQEILIGKKITTEQTVLDDLFYETTTSANRYIKKNKIRGSIVACVVNANDPKNTFLHLDMNPKGNKRGKDRTVFLFSPSGLISHIKKLKKSAPSPQNQRS